MDDCMDCGRMAADCVCSVDGPRERGRSRFPDERQCHDCGYTLDECECVAGELGARPICPTSTPDCEGCGAQLAWVGGCPLAAGEHWHCFTCDASDEPGDGT